jgi:hypothetical protein
MRRLGWNKDWISKEDGNVGIIFAAMLIPTIMLIGGAVDYGDAINKRTLLQAAADAATLAGAKLDDDDPAAIIATAEGIFAAKLEGTALEGITPDVDFADSQLTLTVSTEVPTAFMRMASIDSLEVFARSVAQKGNDDAEAESGTWGNICLLALDPDTSVGIDVQGSKTAELGTCWAYSNSDSDFSVDSTGNSYTFNSGGVCAAALLDAEAIDHNNFNPSVREGCDQIDDPFANVGAYPSAASWDPTFTLPTVSNTTCTANGLSLKKGTYTLNPGQYCGGLEAKAQAKVTFNPGVYIVTDGAFKAWSGAQLTGTNVLFYLYDRSSAANTSSPIFEIQGGATVSLTGRHAGSSYEGYLLIQNALAATGSTSTIQGGGTFNMEGVLYLPTQKLEMGGNGSMNGSSHYFMAVAKSFYIYGSGTLTVKDHDGSSPLPDITPEMPDLDSQAARLVE